MILSNKNDLNGMKLPNHSAAAIIDGATVQGNPQEVAPYQFGIVLFTKVADEPTASRLSLVMS